MLYRYTIINTWPCRFDTPWTIVSLELWRICHRSIRVVDVIVGVNVMGMERFMVRIGLGLGLGLGLRLVLKQHEVMHGHHRFIIGSYRYLYMHFTCSFYGSKATFIILTFLLAPVVTCYATWDSSLHGIALLMWAMQGVWEPKLNEQPRP